MAEGSKTINNIMQHSNKHRCTVKPCGILLGILGGGVLLCFPNPDPISDQKLLFSTPDFRPGLKAEIMSSLLRLERKQKNSSKIFRIRIFLCLSYSFGTEMINPIDASKAITNSRPKWAKCIPVFRPNTSL